MYNKQQNTKYITKQRLVIDLVSLLQEDLYLTHLETKQKIVSFSKQVCLFSTLVILIIWQITLRERERERVSGKQYLITKYINQAMLVQ